jgi:GNAT superfamily N-acetyltransferase
MAIEVRRATAADVACVCEFNRLLALESEGKTLDPEVLACGVRAVLEDANKGLYFLAVEEDLVLGQMGITFEWSDWRNGWFWWLQSVYVRHEARRRGVFSRLFEHIRGEASANPRAVIGLRLYVENANSNAHATYRKLGFEWTSYQVMEKLPL